MRLSPLSLLAFVFTVSAVHASSQFDLNCQRQADSKCPAGAKHYSSDNSDMYYYQCMRVGWISLNKVTKQNNMRLDALSFLAFGFIVSAVRASSRYDIGCQKSAYSNCPSGTQYYNAGSWQVFYYQCMKNQWVAQNVVTKGCSSPTTGCKCLGGCLAVENPKDHPGEDIQHYCASSCLIGSETAKSCYPPPS
ncbi:hypothetical protein CF326_g313 [Tilletia indica]|nr:hypothetical protein CF326_g313 [Tilletia indica]